MAGWQPCRKKHKSDAHKAAVRLRLFDAEKMKPDGMSIWQVTISSHHIMKLALE
jgi:hypothetical protein